MRDDWAVELYASIAKQALKDYAAGYHKHGHMDAAQWLRLAGLLTEDGTLDQRGYGRIGEVAHGWKAKQGNAGRSPTEREQEQAAGAEEARQIGG